MGDFERSEVFRWVGKIWLEEILEIEESEIISRDDKICVIFIVVDDDLGSE